MTAAADAQRFVIAAAVVSGIVIAARALRGGDVPAARPAMGLTVATVMLLLAAPHAPKLSTAMAATMATGVVFAAGADTIAGFGDLSSSSTSEPSAARRRSVNVENEGVTVTGVAGQIID